jgi:recombination protein RecT
MLVKLANEEPKTNQVGWLGNFNDMSVKTCLRRLLSKHGFLSVEMQQVISREIDSENAALVGRNEAIAENGNAQIIDVESITVENVDETTGEIKDNEQKPDWA